VKTHQPLELERFLGELAAGAQVAWSFRMERGFADRLLLNWDQVRELRKVGMDVQSHTRTHRVLQTLRPDELSDELAGSRADLERELGEPTRGDCLPRRQPGSRQFANPRHAVEKAGYEIGFSNGYGDQRARRRG